MMSEGTSVVQNNGDISSKYCAGVMLGWEKRSDQTLGTRMSTSNIPSKLIFRCGVVDRFLATMQRRSEELDRVVEDFYDGMT